MDKRKRAEDQWATEQQCESAIEQRFTKATVQSTTGQEGIGAKGQKFEQAKVHKYTR